MPIPANWTVTLRRTSEVEHFPWNGNRVTLIKVCTKTYTITQAKTRVQKREMVLGLLPDEILLAAWPGNWSQDIFLIDNVQPAIRDLV